MPLYAYACSYCGKDHEALQKLNDAPLTQCPHCQQQALMRKLTAPNFRLKGSGWYETDFKTDKDAKRNLVDSPVIEDKKGEKTEKTAKNTEKSAQKSEKSATDATAVSSNKSPQKSTPANAVSGKSRQESPSSPAGSE